METGSSSMSMNDQFDQMRRRLPGVGAIPGAAFFNDRLNDAVLLLAALPEIAAHLRTVQEHVVHMDDEIVCMRITVDRLEHEVKNLRLEIDDLSGHMTQVSASVHRLEPHVADISRLTRPLKRMRHRAAERAMGGENPDIEVNTSASESDCGTGAAPGHAVTHAA
jgi:hypothetical protein